MSSTPKTSSTGKVAVLHTSSGKTPIPDHVLKDLATPGTEKDLDGLSTPDRDRLLQAIPTLCRELLSRRVAMRSGIV